MPQYTGVKLTIPAQDIERLKSFFSEKLGLDSEGERPEGMVYRAGSTEFYLYPSQYAGTAQHTLAGFEVDDIEAAVAELKSKGVTFEQYDTPDFKTDENGIATLGDNKVAWFKDSEGNILAVGQPSG